MNTNTYKITVHKITPEKFNTREDAEMTFPSLQAASIAAGVLHEVIGDSRQDIRVGRDYNILIAEI